MSRKNRHQTRKLASVRLERSTQLERLAARQRRAGNAEYAARVAAQAAEYRELALAAR